MSRWESVPFDILQLELSYLDLEDAKNIEALCGDPVLSVRLQCEEPNGFIWKYLYTHKLSHILPVEGPSLEERCYEILNRISSGSSDVSLLKLAILRDYEILVEKLLKEEYSPEDLYGILLTATIYGRLYIIKFLVERGIDSGSLSEYALNLAVERGHIDIVKYFLDHGNFTFRQLNKSLILASRFGHLQIVKLLVERGADVRSEYNAALSTAAINGYLNVVKYLLDHGANLESLDSYTLNMASRAGHSNVVDYITKLRREQFH